MYAGLLSMHAGYYLISTGRAYLKKNAIFLKWAFLPENLDLSSLNICENGGKISFESAQPF
jgi:hypothetical protein